MASAPRKNIIHGLERLPADLREPAKNAFVRIDKCLADPSSWPQPSADDVTTFCRLLATSEFFTSICVQQTAWFIAAFKDGLLNEEPQADFKLPDGSADHATIAKEMRRHRNRKLLNILWREYSGQVALEHTLGSLSQLADEMIEASKLAANEILSLKFGAPRNQHEVQIPMLVLAMGKLGGNELNVSSDIDIVFLYSEDGQTDGARKLTAQEYFVRLARLTTRLLDEVTEDGFVFRVDTRLRPFGDSGPPVASFAALESYLLRHGRDWERYAYVKARVVGNDCDSDDANELMSEVVRPFVYRRYLDYGVFSSLREMKGLIETEGKRRELSSNIKIGPGGIREIEFIVQSLQLVRGGSNNVLQSRSLGTALHATVRAGLLTVQAGEELLAAYRFLRRLENFIQALRDRQTHDLPDNPLDRERISFAMHQPTWESLVEALDQHRNCVAHHFREIVFRADGDTKSRNTDNDLAIAWQAAADVVSWTALLVDKGFAEPEKLAQEISGFAGSQGVQQIGATSRSRLDKFVPSLLRIVRGQENPVVALKRVLGVVDRVLRRSAYIALLNENNMVLQRLVDLCSQSAYLADEISRYPMLLDEMLDSRFYAADFSAERMRHEFVERSARIDFADSEREIEALAQFQRAALFRIAIADFNGNMPIMEVSDALTALAEIVLVQALKIAWSDMTDKNGEPEFTVGDIRERAGFAVIAYGKLGGMELSYGSDLDLVFLHNSAGSDQYTNGEVSLDNSMFFARLVRRLTHFLTTQTPSGALYDVDTRLRPSGRSGMLVTSLDGFERYQTENAWTWEHQALLRSRVVAGSQKIARDFERIRRRILQRQGGKQDLASQVAKMRARMRATLDKSNDEYFDLKQGCGGITDIEFLVQYLALKFANLYPSVIFYPDNVRQLGTLSATGCLHDAMASQLQTVYQIFRARLHRLAMNSEPPLVSNIEFADERAFVRGLWEQALAPEDSN